MTRLAEKANAKCMSSARGMHLTTRSRATVKLALLAVTALAGSQLEWGCSSVGQL